MIEGTTCEFCGKPSASKKALYSHRKRCKIYQKYKTIMETISLAVKNNIINRQEVPVEDLIHEATESIDETINEIKKKNPIESIIKETIVKNPEPNFENDEELTVKKSYELYIRDTIQDIHVQLGEIRRIVRRLAEIKELNAVENI